MLGSAWKSVAPLIEKSLKYSNGKVTLRNIYELIEDEKAQLFIAIDKKPCFAWVTEIQEYASGKILVITFAGGENSAHCLKDVFGLMEKWAAEIGCRAIEINGRPGWEKLLKMKRTSVTLRKEIGDKE